MKKLVIAIAIVVPLVIATIGATTIAASPPGSTPVDALNYIVEKVDEILTAVNNGTTNITTQLGAALGEVDGKIDDLASDVADIEANMVRMETYSDSVWVPLSAHNTSVGGNYTEVRHVVVTMRASLGLGTGDTIDVAAYWPGDDGAYVAEFDDTDPYACKTFEFNANYWTIHYKNSTETPDWPFSIKYSVTTTYVPEP